MNTPHHTMGENTVHEPPCGEPFWVQCEGFRCLAVRDHHNQWRMLYNNKPIAGEVNVLDDQMTWRTDDSHHWSIFRTDD